MMQFPTMVSLQGALPNLPAASDLVQTSSFGTQSQGLTAPQSPSYTSAMSPFSPSLTSAMPTGKFTQIFFFPSDIFAGPSVGNVQFNNLRCKHGATST